MEAGKKPAVFVFTTAYHPFIGGVEVAIQEVTQRLKGEFDFFIFTARFRRDLARRETRGEGTIIRVGVGSAVDKWLFPVWGILSALGERRRLRGRRTLLWGMDISAGAGVAAALNLLIPQLPFVLTIQYGYGGKRLARGRLGLIGLGFRFMLGRADAVTAISTYLAGTARQFGYRRDVAVIPNGVAVERFRADRNHRTDPARPTLITVSRLVPKNGVDTLIRAIAVIKPDIPGIRCHILGGGPERPALEALARSLKVEPAIQFFGSVPYETVPSHLAAADIFVRPSRSEGMGNAFVEALAAGLPIIGTPVEGILDIIRDGETGLFCRVDDPADLTEKIKRLLTDRELARRIVKNGQAMAEERFSWDSITLTYRQIFKRTLERPLRILIATGIFPPDIGGPATYAAFLLQELPKRSVSVRILTYTDSPQSAGDAVVAVSRQLPKGVRHLSYFLRCLRLAGSVDVIYALDTVSTGLPAVLAAKLLRKRLYLRVVGDYAWEQGVMRFGVRELLDDFPGRRSGWRVAMLRRIQSFVAGSSDRVIVPSHYLRRIVSRWGVPAERISVISNAVDLPAVMPTREASRRELRIPAGETVIVSAGRLVPWKGFGVLIEMMPHLLQHYPSAKLYLIGEGPEKERLQESIRSFALGGHVVLVGNVPRGRLLRYLRAADVFVLNTGYEGFSHQLIEAMAAGVVVATTPSGGNAEVVRDGENALLFAYNRADEMQERISRLLDSPALRERLARNAAGVVREKFSLDRMITRLLDTL